MYTINTANGKKLILNTVFDYMASRLGWARHKLFQKWVCSDTGEEILKLFQMHSGVEQVLNRADAVEYMCDAEPGFPLQKEGHTDTE